MADPAVSTVIVVAASIWAGLAWVISKLSALDVKVDVVAQSGKTANIDVIIGGRRKTDPPMPPPPQLPVLLPVDRRD